jgi:hypothetical protein
MTPETGAQMNRILIWSAAGAIAICAAFAASAQQPSAPAPQAPMAPAVLGSGQFNENPDLRCDVLEVKRVSGGALLIRWRLVNSVAGGGSGGLSGGGAAQPIHWDFHWVDMYYIDPAENKKYEIITDSDGNRIMGIWTGDLTPGQQRLSWPKFAAPPTTSTKISFNISGFAPFEDLPISQ